MPSKRSTVITLPIMSTAMEKAVRCGASLVVAALACTSDALAQDPWDPGIYPYLCELGQGGPLSDVAVFAPGDYPGFVAVADRGNRSITLFKGDGCSNYAFTSYPLGYWGNLGDIGLAVNDMRGSTGFGDVYACDYQTSPPEGRLWVFNVVNGNVLSLKCRLSLTEALQPIDVALDAKGNVYVADSVTASGLTYKYLAAAVQTAVLACPSSLSSEPTPFLTSAPRGISVDHNYRLHVVSDSPTNYTVYNSNRTPVGNNTEQSIQDPTMSVDALSPYADGFITTPSTCDLRRYSWNWCELRLVDDLRVDRDVFGRPEGNEYQKFTYGINRVPVGPERPAWLTEIPHWEEQRCEERMFVCGLHGHVGSRVSVFGQTYSSVPVPSGAVAWWRFEETQKTSFPEDATTYFDALGSNNATPDVVVGSVPRTVEGMVRSAFDTRDGTAFAAVPDDPALNFGPNGSMSIEGWIRSEQKTGVATLLDKRVGEEAGYELFLYNGQLGFQANMGGLTYLNYAPGSGCGDQAAVGAWKQFAVVLDRRDPNQALWTIKVYLDGIAVGNAGTPPAGNMNNNGKIYLGTTNPGVTPTPFQGAMDELTIYNEPLTAAAIMDIYNARTAGKNVYVKSRLVDIP